jgi:type VI secretion system secreted protein Hcp
MAVEGYMYFLDYQGKYLDSESQVKLTQGNGDNPDILKPFLNANSGLTAPQSHLFEIEDYSFDIEQTLSIGSQSTGAGTGRCQFNPFSITRKIDCASAHFFKMACSGKTFQTVGLGLRKSAGNDAAGVMYLAFTFKLVAVKTVSWAHDDEAPKETVTFEYGGVIVQYAPQQAKGLLSPVQSGGWNRVKNVAIQDINSADWDIK